MSVSPKAFALQVVSREPGCSPSAQLPHLAAQQLQHPPPPPGLLVVIARLKQGLQAEGTTHRLQHLVATPALEVLVLQAVHQSAAQNAHQQLIAPAPPKVLVLQLEHKQLNLLPGQVPQQGLQVQRSSFLMACMASAVECQPPVASLRQQ
eukprot:CAMPEP_0202921024 /NCGR_PEP_ID=MMETSP1392-20130828/77171_1 /ASSEMBLY_ACC=CAM_ASM_000868 /TAXON_ID=225041 /ORGANISM="Chlamydomonas chlamydogama, Strain SAG 11-48b" /LENGTH=149 /DNA_ID=CAMNT_0049614561 /DNA_START=142 /DNA_END=592 /DNA_ORIENTATION=+